MQKTKPSSYILNKAYFLTRIYRPVNENGNNNHQVSSVFLEPVFNRSNNRAFSRNARDIIFLDSERHEDLTTSINIGELEESTFVKIQKIPNETKYKLVSIENDTNEYVSINKQTHSALLAKIANLSTEHDSTKFTTDDIDQVFSYHVNVGHGNTSFIIITYIGSNKPSAIGIDCSIGDTKHVKSKNNIKSCIQYIKRKFDLKNFELDIFILTHPHYDHYSGIQYLISDKHITSDTEVWLNYHYAVPSSFYNNILAQLESLRCKFVEPTSSISSKIATIWHPRQSTTSKHNRHPVFYFESNPNNASVVVQFTFKNTSILFTGDIETIGWDMMKCPPHMGNVHYYCISHHGSRNGHIRNTCHLKHNIKSVATCPNKIHTAILMGRDGSYRGIYSNDVMTDFTNILQTEKNASGQKAIFLEINILNNICRHEL